MCEPDEEGAPLEELAVVAPELLQVMKVRVSAQPRRRTSAAASAPPTTRRVRMLETQ